jgi:hypothetical protein
VIVVDISVIWWGVVLFCGNLGSTTRKEAFAMIDATVLMGATLLPTPGLGTALRQHRGGRAINTWLPAKE